MTETFALAYLESRRKQLGAIGYDLSYKHLALDANEKLLIQAAGTMWLLIEADEHLLIQSDTGQYHLKSQSLRVQNHEHTGQLSLQNNGIGLKQVRFVVVTWQYASPNPAQPAAPQAA